MGFIVLPQTLLDMDAEFIAGLGDLVASSFVILEMLGNNFNYLIMAVGFLMMLGWIRRMAKYNKEAAENGTLK